MDIEKAVRRIVSEAVCAPSGDNAQPWRFSLSGNTLNIFNVRGRDATLYNFRERGSYLAHGALAENIAIAAPHAGLNANITPFPGKADCTAVVSFTEGNLKKDPLYDAIAARATNRKPYRAEPLTRDDAAALRNAASAIAGTSLKFIEDEDSISRIAEAVSVNERLLMENRELHDFLFGIILWKPEEERLRQGLYIKTMEFPPPVRFMMRRVIKHWRAVQLLNRIGLSKAIPKQSASVYRASAAIGAVIITGERDGDFFAAGRSTQRVWLSAASRNLQMQPITAMPYLYQRVRAGETKSLATEHMRLITDAHEVISRAFQLKDSERIAMLFRIGYGEGPTAKSARLPPVFAS